MIARTGMPLRDRAATGRPASRWSSSVASILVLLMLGLALVSIVVEDSDLSVNQVRSNQAFYAAHAGVEYAVQKLAANPTWTGTSLAGKDSRRGLVLDRAPDRWTRRARRFPSAGGGSSRTAVAGDALRSVQVHVASGGSRPTPATACRATAATADRRSRRS